MTTGLDLTDADFHTLDECEAVIRSGLRTFIDVGTALMRIRDGRLYRAGFPTFEDYCQAAWSLSRTRAYELMDAAGTVGAVSAIADTPPPANEGQARELRGLPADTAAEVMRKAHDDSAGKVTASAIRQAREVVAPRPAAPQPESAPDPWAARIACELAASDDSYAEQATAPEPSPALTDYLESSQGAKDSGYVREFMGALHRAHAVLRFDPARLADLLDENEVRAVADHAASLARFTDTLRRGRSGLRVINGGN
jgi:hypothetical protein